MGNLSKKLFGKAEAGDATSVRRRLRLGDKIASITSAVGIKPCEPCRRRQAFLNGEKYTASSYLPEDAKTDLI